MCLALTLAGCAGGHRPGLATARVYPGLSCAPFARALTGFALSGDAADWWREAAGRFARGAAPEVGAVLVFRRTARLPAGHVSVVSAILDRRHIAVIQANWVPGELDLDQPVVDESEANDWSAARVWYPPSGEMGAHVYPTLGFILPPAPRRHDALLLAAEPAARAASGS